MTVAMEKMREEDDGYGNLPIFSRGAELEIAGQQDVEMLKQMLAKLKVHIPTKTLERAIILPRDFDNNRPAYPKQVDQYPENIEKTQRDAKKKKGRRLDEAEL